MKNDDLSLTNQLSQPFNYVALGAWTLTWFFAIFFRLYGISTIGLEYDEVWTIHYVIKTHWLDIFSDISIPNNHPLNSLLIRLSTSAFGNSLWAVRFPAFLSGIGLLIGVFALSRLVLRNRIAVWLAVNLAAFSPPLISYAQKARGYSLQACILVWLIICILKSERFKSYSIKHLISLTALAFLPPLAFLTISSSPLFVAPLFLTHLFWILTRRFHDSTSYAELLRKYAGTIIAYFIGLGTCALWLWHGYEHFQHGKTIWETHQPETGWQLAVMTVERLHQLCWWPILLAALFFAGKQWKKNYGKAMILIIFFPFIIAPLTSIGPARVYLPLHVLLNIAAAGGVTLMLSFVPQNKRNQLLSAILVASISVTAAIAGPLKVSRWRPPDWNKFFPQICKFGEHFHQMYISYPADAGLTINFHYPRSSILQHMERLPRGENWYLAQVGSKTEILGANWLGTAAALQAPPTKVLTQIAEMIVIAVYGLKRIEINDSQTVFPPISIAVIPRLPPQQVEELHQDFFMNRKWHFLNMFLRTPVFNVKKKELVSGRVFAASGTDLSLDELKKIWEASNRKISFYELNGISNSQ